MDAERQKKELEDRLRKFEEESLRVQEGKASKRKLNVQYGTCYFPRIHVYFLL